MRTELINAYITISDEAENKAFNGVANKYLNAARDCSWEMLTQDEKVKADEIMADREVSN